MAFSAIAAVSSQGAVLAEWDTTGFTGTETSITFSGVPTGLSVTAITLGAGLGTGNGGGGINTNGWVAADLNGANGNYYGFSITVAASYEVELTSWELAVRSSNTGPRDFAVRYSGDTFDSNIDTFSTSGSAYRNAIVDLSSLGVLTEGTYEFRVGLTSNTSSNGTATVGTGGTHRIMNFDSTSSTAGTKPINLNGTVTLIPEPTAALLGGLGLLTLLRRRR